MLNKLLDLEHKSSIACLVAGGAGLMALALVRLLTGGAGLRELAVMALLPLLCLAMALRERRRLLLSALVIGISFSARYRPAGIEYHRGGAELAIAPLDLALLGLVLICAPRLAESWPTIKRRLRPMAGPLAFLLIAHLPSLAIAADPGLAAIEIARLAKMVLLLATLACCIRDRRDVEFVVRLLIVVALLQGTLAIAQWIRQGSLGLGMLGEHAFVDAIDADYVQAAIGRSGGTLGHANALASFLELLLPLALAIVLARAPSSRPWRLIAALTLLVGTMGALATLSRAGWIALPAGLLLASILSFGGLRSLLRRATPALIVLLVLLAIVGLLGRQQISQRVSGVLSTSLRFRLTTARVSLNMIKAHPLLGIGANNYEVVSEGYFPSDPTSYKPRNARMVVHNILLLYWSEMGPLGVTALLYLLYTAGRLAWQVIHTGDSLSRALGIGALSGLGALLLHNQIGWAFRYDPIHTLFWLLIGLLVVQTDLNNIAEGSIRV
jgi:putative inorganic carbon (hco3(-)) transporter